MVLPAEKRAWKYEPVLRHVLALVEEVLVDRGDLNDLAALRARA
jgi:hypothetical protein